MWWRDIKHKNTKSQTVLQIVIILQLKIWDLNMNNTNISYHIFKCLFTMTVFGNKGYSFWNVAVTWATTTVGDETKSSRVQLYANKQWSDVGTPTSNRQHWELWPAAISSMPVWLWLYCVNNWLICVYFCSFQRTLAETCEAKLMLEWNYKKLFCLVFQ